MMRNALTNRDTELDAVFEALMLDQLDFETPCDGVPALATGSCDNPAKWQALFACGCTRLWCDDHKERTEKIIATEGGTWCNTCWQRDGSWIRTTILFMDALKSS